VPPGFAPADVLGFESQAVKSAHRTNKAARRVLKTRITILQVEEGGPEALPRDHFQRAAVPRLS
jgi:hypothetical protein